MALDSQHVEALNTESLSSYLWFHPQKNRRFHQLS